MEDVDRACAAIGRFVDGRELELLGEDELLRSAAERQPTSVGEAVTQLARLDPETADLMPDRRAMLGLRDILMHAYGRLDHDVIADIVVRDVPELARIVADLLGQTDAGTRQPRSP